VCLASGQIPAGAGSCDAITGEGCATHETPVSAQDAQGSPACVCLQECNGTGAGGGSTGGGAGGGTGGGTSGGSSVECLPCIDDSTCGDGYSAGCWLADDYGNPAFCALDCTDTNSCPTGSTCLPDGGGSPYSTCIPDAACDESSTGGGTGGSTGGGAAGSCPVGTCEPISGGSVCLDNGELPAGTYECDPFTGEGCALDTVPVGVTFTDGTDGCVCLYEC